MNISLYTRKAKSIRVKDIEVNMLRINNITVEKRWNVEKEKEK